MRRHKGEDFEAILTPGEVVYRKHRIRLIHYRPARKTLRHPLLIVYSFINRMAILDLKAGCSLLQDLLAGGIEVYIIDWGDPTQADCALTISDHVNGYMDEIVSFIHHRHGQLKINMMGICMGGTLSVIYTCLYHKKIKNLITIVTPTRFDLKDEMLPIWIQGMDIDAAIDAFGNMPGLLVVLGLLWVTPLHLLIEKYCRLFVNSHDEGFVDTFLRLEKWMFDSPDIPGMTFRQFIKDCYQKNLLIRNRMVVGGKRINLRHINMPLLNVIAKHDHLVTPAACQTLVDCVGGSDNENFCLDTGHLGIFVSGKSRNTFVQKITQWLGERDDIEESMQSITNSLGAIRRFRCKKRSFSRKPAQALF